jgi:hypothetical protein
MVAGKLTDSCQKKYVDNGQKEDSTETYTVTGRDSDQSPALMESQPYNGSEG